MEHFFTVLVAGAIFSRNENLGEDQDTESYVRRFVVRWGSLAHTMRYASRFADEDGVHKLLWAGFQFGLLLLLEGFSSSGFSSSNSSSRWSLFKVTSLPMYLFVALALSRPIVVWLPRARPLAAFYALVSLSAAALLLSLASSEGVHRPLLYIVAALAVFPDACVSLALHAFLQPGGALQRRIGMPVNAEYLINRFEGLQLEILTVAVIVPNTVYPTRIEHTSLVVCGDVLVCVLAIALKAALFDLAPTHGGCADEPSWATYHAIARSERTRHLFLIAQPAVALGIAITGGALAMLLKEVDQRGSSGEGTYAQALMGRGRSNHARRSRIREADARAAPPLNPAGQSCRRPAGGGGADALAGVPRRQGFRHGGRRRGAGQPRHRHAALAEHVLSGGARRS